MEIFSPDCQDTFPAPASRNSLMNFSTRRYESNTYSFESSSVLTTTTKPLATFLISIDSILFSICLRSILESQYCGMTTVVQFHHNFRFHAISIGHTPLFATKILPHVVSSIPNFTLAILFNFVPISIIKQQFMLEFLF